MARKGERLTVSEIQYIVENYKKISTEEIAKKLRITKISLYSRIRTLVKKGTIKNVKSKNLQSDIEYIEENFGKMTNKEIAKTLGRSQRFVREKVMLLHKENRIENPSRKHKKITAKEIDEIYENAHLTSKVMGERLGISPSTVRKYRNIKREN